MRRREIERGGRTETEAGTKENVPAVRRTKTKNGRGNGSESGTGTGTANERGSERGRGSGTTSLTSIKETQRLV